MILGIALFIFVLFGYVNFFTKVCGLYHKTSWIASIAFIVLVLYTAAYFQFLTQASNILILFGLAYGLWTIYLLIKNKSYKNWKMTFLGTWIILFSAMFIRILTQIHLNHYDNYSHWAVIVKFLFTEDRLPTVNDAIIAYTSYPMGSSLFLYFATQVAGFNEHIMMIGQFMIIVACIYSMFSIVRDESRIMILSMMFSVIAIFNYFNTAIRLNNLLVDFLLPLITLAGIAGIFRMRYQIKQVSLYSFLVVAMLTLVKASATFFAAIIIAYYLFEMGKRLLESKHKIIVTVYALVTTGLSFLPITIWNAYVKANFPITKHEVSVSAYQSIFGEKDTTVIEQISQLFMRTITSLQTLSTQGIVLTQIIMIVAYLIIRFRVKRKNPILWQLLLIDGIVIVYYLGIYAMFLFSMPTEEALYLAGFDRYASSIVILALGLAMMFLAREIDYSLYEQNVAKRNFKSYKNIQTKKLYQGSSIFLLFVSTLLLLSESGGLLYNNAQFNASTAAEYAKVTPNNMVLNNEKYLVVSTNKTDVENYFVGFYGKYWLYSPNVDGQENFVMDEADFRALLERYDKIVILEDHFTFNEMTELISGKTYAPGIYDSQTILEGK